MDADAKKAINTSYMQGRRSNSPDENNNHHHSNNIPVVFGLIPLIFAKSDPVASDDDVGKIINNESNPHKFLDQNMAVTRTIPAAQPLGVNMEVAGIDEDPEGIYFM